MDRELEASYRYRRLGRRVAFGVGIAALCVAVLVLLPGWLRPSVAREQIRTGRVDRGPVEGIVEASGTVVPAFEGTIGLKSRLLVRDREMLISGPKRGFTPLAPVRLADCKPLKIVAPGPDNTRRRNLETYFQTHGVEIEAMLDMDAMIGTLEFVARSDWTTILPSVISVNDIGRGELIVNPIVEPELHAEFVVIQPARRTLSTPARIFLQRFEQEVAHIHDVWDAAIAAPKRRRA